MFRRQIIGRMRRVSIWLLGGVIALVGVFTVQQATDIEAESARRERARTMQELSNLVALWEGLITDRIRTWTTDLEEAPSAQREQQLRTTVTWFDAYYRWTVNGDLTWPKAAPSKTIATHLDEPCLSAANSLRVTGKALDSAIAFEACTPNSPAHGLVATYLAARVRLEAGHHKAALLGLERAAPPLRMPLVSGVDRGLDVGMLVQRRNLALQAMQELGRDDAHGRLTADTIQAITQLPAADLTTHIKRAESLLKDAPEDLPERERLERSIDRANRRLVAYRELQSRLMSESRDAEPGELHIVQDLYSKPGFLLVWTAIDDRRRAAVQVDASDLLQSLSETLPHTTGVYVVDARACLSASTVESKPTQSQSRSL